MRGRLVAMTDARTRVAAPGSQAARAGVLMAVATAAMAVASAAQAVLYLSEFGVTARTDAFFAAFALYTVSGIFAQAIRVTSVPLLVAAGGLDSRTFGAALAVIGLPVLVVTLPLAGALAAVLAPGAEAGARGLTEEALRILGPAIVLQIGAAGGATVLGMRGRWSAIASAYVAGAVAGLATFLAARSAAGELTLGWSMLAMAVVTAGWMAAAAAGSRTSRPGALRPGPAVVAALVILGRTLVYFVINGLVMVTLAVVSHDAAGDVTVLSYAYLFASYLVAGTSVAIGISRAPDMARGASADWHDVVADTVPHGYRYAAMVVAPALAALVVAGAAVVGELLPGSFGPGDVDALQRFALALAPWTLAALLVNFALPALFALGRARLLNLLAVPVIAVHVAATLAAERLGGSTAAAAALAVAPLAFAAVLVAVGARDRAGAVARQVAVDTLRFGGLAAVAFAAAWAAGTPLGEGLARHLAVVVLGAALYVAGLRVVAPGQLAVLLGARRAPAV
jgi:putative peptidoglycan lipid II flippase